MCIVVTCQSNVTFMKLVTLYFTRIYLEPWSCPQLKKTVIAEPLLILGYGNVCMQKHLCLVRSPCRLKIRPHSHTKVLSWDCLLAAQILYFLQDATLSPPSRQCWHHSVLSWQLGTSHPSNQSPAGLLTSGPSTFSLSHDMLFLSSPLQTIPLLA